MPESAGIKPAKILRSVDFPLPFAPASADINGDDYVNAQDFSIMMRRTVRINSTQRYAIQASKIISNLNKKVINENNSQELFNYLKDYKKKSVTNTSR